MPRPRKWRKVCAVPRCVHFAPSQNNNQSGVVKMTVDEYEAIRLIDLEGFTQEQCSGQMEVARTTVQAIYQSARRKLADCIVNGKILVITGGEYHICEHGNECCGHGRSCCYKKGGTPCPKNIKKVSDYV